MAIRIGFLASLGFDRMETEEVCRHLKRLGYQSVEWPLSRCHPREKSPAEIREVVRMTRDHGLTPSEVVVQQDYVTTEDAVHADRVALTVSCIDVLREAGFECLNVFTGPAAWNPAAPVVGRDISEGEAWGRIFRAFDGIVPRAEAAGMKIAVEGVWGMAAHDFYTCRFLVDHYRSAVLGVNFDPSHDVLAGNLDIPWIIRQWGDRIHHCHLKDAVGVPEAGRFVFPLLGEGRVDWPAYFHTLEEVGFDGTCSVEFESFDYLANVLDNDGVEAARISMEALKRLRA